MLLFGRNKGLYEALRIVQPAERFAGLICEVDLEGVSYKRVVEWDVGGTSSRGQVSYGLAQSGSVRGVYPVQNMFVYRCRNAIKFSMLFSPRDVRYAWKGCLHFEKIHCVHSGICDIVRMPIRVIRP